MHLELHKDRALTGSRQTYQFLAENGSALNRSLLENRNLGQIWTDGSNRSLTRLFGLKKQIHI